MRAALALALACASGAASAHPHVWVATRTAVVFDAAGKIAGLRQSWAFDDMYSAFATQGIGESGKTPTREELAPLAKTNIDSLAEFGYFTVAKSNGRQTDFAAPVDYWVEVDDAKIATLHFLLPLKTPANARTFSFQIYDPTFFVDFSPEKTAAVTMENGKPGCSASIVEPPPLLAEDAAKKDESFYSGLSPGSDFGIKLAARAIVACP